MNAESTPSSLPPEGPQPSSEPAATTVVGGRSEFSARLESFQGPLDLLLYLIKENEVEVTGIPIAKILQQYLGYLDAAAEWDLHLAGEFLVMAATLMEIKSRELLPAQESAADEELIEDPRAELIRQLLRYRLLKEQARALEEAQEAWARHRPRGLYDEIPEPAVAESGAAAPEWDFDLFELLTSFEKLKREVLFQVPKKIAYEGETLEEKLVRIEALLREKPFARFAELVFDRSSRADIAMTFVALLELVRRRMIRLLQDADYRDINVRVQTAEEAEALAREEAAAAEEVVDAALREREAREARLAAEAAALGVEVDRLPWQRRRAAQARPKFDGLIRPEDVEEIDAQEAEIARRIDAILAAADAISQRFEDGRTAEQTAAGAPAAPEHPNESDGEEKPLTEADLEPQPELPQETPAPGQPKSETQGESAAPKGSEEGARN